jgi:hypothetical protein
MVQSMEKAKNDPFQVEALQLMEWCTGGHIFVTIKYRIFGKCKPLQSGVRRNTANNCGVRNEFGAHGRERGSIIPKTSHLRMYISQS